MFPQELYLCGDVYTKKDKFSYNLHDIFPKVSEKSQKLCYLCAQGRVLSKCSILKKNTSKLLEQKKVAFYNSYP